MKLWLALGLIVLLSYLLGSISFAVIISRLCAKDDVRTHGSGNAGMTNMLRTYGKRLAALTLIGDFGKGVLAIVLSRVLWSQMQLEFALFDPAYIAGLFVLLGHLYPVFFGFRGGKGVLTTIGIILVINPVVFLLLVAVFLPVILITRIVSLGSICGAISYPILTFLVDRFLWHTDPFYDTLFACVYGGIVLWMHRSNIKRLLNGTEYRFGQKPKEPEHDQSS